MWKQHQSRNSNVTDVLNQINSSNQSLSHHEDDSSLHKTLMLNPVNESDIAVYQSLQTENNNSNMEDEVMKPCKFNYIFKKISNQYFSLNK